MQHGLPHVGRALFRAGPVSRASNSSFCISSPRSSTQKLPFRSSPLPQQHVRAFTKSSFFTSDWYKKMTGQENPQTTQEVKKYLQQSHDRIFENNKKWAEEMAKKKPEFFKDLSAGQSPDYLWIGELTVHSCKWRGDFNSSRALLMVMRRLLRLAHSRRSPHWCRPW